MRRLFPRASESRPPSSPGTSGEPWPSRHGPLFPRAFLLLALVLLPPALAAAPAPTMAEALAAADKLLESQRWERAVRALDAIVLRIDADPSLNEKERTAARLPVASRIEVAGTAVLAPVLLLVEKKLAAPATNADKALRGLGDFIKLFVNWPSQVSKAQAEIARLEAADPTISRSNAKSELDLVLARTLIDQRRYSEALIALTSFSKTYPDRFDEAQTLFKRIMKDREEYANKVAELNRVILTDENNLELQNRLYAETVRLNPFPDTTTASQLKGLNVGIGLTVVRRSFDAIMEQGKKELEARNWSAALAAYLPGFDSLYRDAFNSYFNTYAGKDAAAVARDVASINEGIRLAEDAADAFSAAQAGLDAAAAGLEESLASGDAASIAAALDLARPRFQAEAGWKELFTRYGSRFQTLRDSLNFTDDPEAEESIFLFFASRLLQGRPPEERGGDASPEGLAGVLVRRRELLFAPIAAALDGRLDREWAAADAAWTQGRYAEAAAAFDRLASLAVPGLATIQLLADSEAAVLAAAPTRVGSPSTQLVPIPPQAAGWERVSHLGRLAEAHARLARLAAAEGESDAAARSFASQLAAGPVLPEAGVREAVARLEEWRSLTAGAVSDLEAERAGAAALAAELAVWARAGLGDPRSASVQGAYDGRLAGLLEKARADEVAIVAAAAGATWRSLGAELAERTKNVELARLNLEGLDDPALGKVFYPSKSAALLLLEEASLAALRERLAALVADLGRAAPYVAGAPAVQAWSEEARKLDRSAAALQATRLELLSRARARAAQAQTARRDADTRRDELGATLARTNLSLADYDSLAARLTTVTQRYADSLGLEYDPALRQSSNDDTARLLARITDGRNAWVVREHRRLVDASIALYSAQDFAGAQENLAKAQDTWAKTHPNEESPEVKYWLTLARSALSANKAKTIPQNAPLYAEMSQLISQATKLYEEGRDLVARGRKVDATARFIGALESVNQVLVVFPLNRDAGILKLKIEQVRDPANFSKLFRQRFDEARTLTRADPATALGSLQVLESIDPKWPGLAAARLEAEYASGAKQRPEDPAKIRQAKALADRARPIVAGRLGARYAEALGYLNEAVQLDPKNADARDLLDRLQILRGGTSTEFTPDDRRVFDAASQDFLESRYADSYSKVRTLWRTLRYRFNQELVDLRDSCEDRLGVPQAERLQ